MMKWLNIDSSIGMEPVSECKQHTWAVCDSRHMAKWLYHTFARCCWREEMGEDSSLPAGWSFAPGSYDEFVHMLIGVYFGLRKRDGDNVPVIWNTFHSQWKVSVDNHYAIPVSRSLLQVDGSSLNRRDVAVEEVNAGPALPLTVISLSEVEIVCGVKKLEMLDQILKYEPNFGDWMIEQSVLSRYRKMVMSRLLLVHGLKMLGSGQPVVSSVSQLGVMDIELVHRFRACHFFTSLESQKEFLKNTEKTSKIGSLRFLDQDVDFTKSNPVFPSVYRWCPRDRLNI